MVTTRTRPEPCPHCGVDIDCLSHATKHAKPGDIGVCFYCAGIVILDDDLHQRLPTEAESEELLTNPRVVRMVFAVRTLMLLGGRS